VVVAVMDVGQVLMFVGQLEVPVLRSGEDSDRVRSVVRIGVVDRVGVLDDVVGVSVAVVAGCDHEDTDQ
jgi:hypothetical protein